MSQNDTHHTPDTRTPSALADLADDVLVERARQKDVRAFEELVGRYDDKLYRLAMRFVRNESDAQEILQDVFLTAWRKLPGFEGRSQFSSWMHRVTVNAALMFLRSRNRHPEVMLEDVEPAAINHAEGHSVHGTLSDWANRPDDQLQSEELRRRIQAAVDALPEGLRTVFLVRDVEGLSTEDTAELLNLSLPAVKTRLHRARLALREAIGQYFAQ